MIGWPDPRPRAAPRPYCPVRWPVGEVVALEPGAAPYVIDLAAVLSNRRSHQPGGVPTIEAIGGLLWHTMRTLDSAPSPYGFYQERRPVPSAGALHPIHVLLQEPGRSDWARYDARMHRLERLVGTESALTGLVEHAQEAGGAAEGIVIAFVAEPGRTSAKYENPATLVWRDAGVLQGTMCAVAQAIDLRVCLLGPTGDSWVSRLANKGQLQGVGLARVVTLQ